MDYKKYSDPGIAIIILVVVATALVMLASTSLYMLGVITLTKAAAQGSSTYTKIKIVKVLPAHNATATAFCNDGDGLLSGGYSIGFKSIKSAFNTMVYSNHPVHLKNATARFEGWQAGLINNGNETATIAATELCLNLTATP
jgi:hypothetical protein